MKALIILVIAAFYSVSSFAQQDLFKKKPWEESKLKELLQDTLSRVSPHTFDNVEQQKNEPGVLKFDLKGVLIAKKPNGDLIYAMSFDNMACLVPSKTFISKMPVLGFSNENKKLLPLIEKDDLNKAK